MKSFTKWMLYLFSSLVDACPRRLQIWLGRGLGWLWFDVFRIRRQLAIDNVQKAFPEWDRSKAKAVARKSLEHLGLTIIEFALFPRIRAGNIDKYIEVEGMDHLAEALQGGKGAFLLGSHMANGDLGIVAFSYSGFPVHLISKKFKAQWLNDIWFETRGRHGTQFIEPRRSSFEILRALKGNHPVVFVQDQYMGPPLGVRTQFFGHWTGTAAGLALFAERTKAPVVPAYTYRRADGRNVLRVEKAIDMPTTPSDRDVIEHMTQIYNDTIERFVRRHPEQWMWVHRRWKKFPAARSRTLHKLKAEERAQ